MQIFARIPTAVELAEEHIAPHMRFKAVFLRNFIYARQVLGKYLTMFFIAVLFQVFTQAQQMSFVHTDIHVASSEIFRKRRKAFVQKFVRRFFFAKKNFFYIE